MPAPTDEIIKWNIVLPMNEEGSVAMFIKKSKLKKLLFNQRRNEG